VSLPPIVGDLDPGIVPLVEALREANFPTVQSCDGHGHSDPRVQIRAPGDVAWVRAEAERLGRWVQEVGLEGWVMVRRYVRPEGADEPFIELVVIREVLEEWTERREGRAAREKTERNGRRWDEATAGEDS
jgi:hypothetical protein